MWGQGPGRRGRPWREVEDRVLEAGLSVMPRVLVMTESPVSREWRGWGAALEKLTPKEKRSGPGEAFTARRPTWQCGRRKSGQATSRVGERHRPGVAWRGKQSACGGGGGPQGRGTGQPGSPKAPSTVPAPRVSNRTERNILSPDAAAGRSPEPETGPRSAARGPLRPWRPLPARGSAVSRPRHSPTLMSLLGSRKRRWRPRRRPRGRTRP